jgi:hypothetical protein
VILDTINDKSKVEQEDHIKIQETIQQRVTEKSNQSKQRQMKVTNRQGHADRHFAQGDWVLLRRDCLRLPKVSKWSQPWLGPYLVVETPSPATLRVDLPSTYKVNPIVNVENAKKVDWNGAPGETIRGDEANDEEELRAETDNSHETPTERPKRSTAGKHPRDKENIWVSQIQGGGECNGLKQYEEYSVSS